MYWAAVGAADRNGSRYPPHAFGSSGGVDFRDWCNEPVSWSDVSRYLYERWKARPDLQLVFPDPLGESGCGLQRWSEADAGYVASTPAAFRGQPFQGVEPGINLVGYLAGELGVASASRVMSA